MRPSKLALSFLVLLSSTQLKAGALETNLKKTVEELGLDPTKQKLFETEVLPNPQPFLLGSAPLDEEHEEEAKIDRDKLRKYLNFSAANFKGPSICIYLRAPKDKPVSDSMRSTVRQDLVERLERRGFHSAPGPQALEESELWGDKAFEEYVLRASDAGCEGALYAEIFPDRSVEDDVNLNELKLQLSGSISLKAKDPGPNQKIKSSAAIQFSVPKDSAIRTKQMVTLGQKAGYLFGAEIFSRLQAPEAALAQAKSQARNQNAQQERTLQLQGVQTFSNYVEFKEKLTSALPKLKLEERIISPGSFQFAVGGEVSMTELAAKLRELKFNIQGFSANEIGVVLK